MRKIHSVLTYQTESKRMGCINRDENAVNNMIKIVKSYIDKKERDQRNIKENINLLTKKKMTTLVI